MISDKPLKTVGFRISEEDYEKLEKVAKAQKKTKSALFRDFINNLKD